MGKNRAHFYRSVGIILLLNCRELFKLVGMYFNLYIWSIWTFTAMEILVRIVNPDHNKMQWCRNIPSCHVDHSYLSQAILLQTAVLPENASTSLPFLRYFDIMFFEITTTPSVCRFIATCVRVYCCRVCTYCAVNSERLGIKVRDSYVGIYSLNIVLLCTHVLRQYVV